MGYENVWYFGLILPVVYFLLRRKAWMIYVFDILIVALSLLILYIFIPPHRIYGFDCAIHAIFR
jgi:hypothetical protein